MSSSRNGVSARHALGASVPCTVAAETADAEHADAASPAAPLLGWLHVALLAHWAVAAATLVDDDWGLLRGRRHHHWLLHHHWLGHHDWLRLNVGDLHQILVILILKLFINSPSSS